ncbi:MAG TPA: hypothetical protein VJI69_09095 [Bacteroidia bacterium]|nr:hypothetical protein [Bacteroidia bacterium]
MDEVLEAKIQSQPKMEKSQVKTIPTGEQTQITESVKEVANSIQGEGIVAAMKIGDYIKSIDVVPDATEPDFRRTADQILSDNKYNGCNEAGAVFASLLRTKGIPTIFIQALNKDAVQSYSPEHKSLNGHVSLEVDFGDRENPNVKIVNSTTEEISDKLPDNDCRC